MGHSILIEYVASGGLCSSELLSLTSPARRASDLTSVCQQDSVNSKKLKSKAVLLICYLILMSDKNVS